MPVHDQDHITLLQKTQCTQGDKQFLSQLEVERDSWSIIIPKYTEYASFSIFSRFPGGVIFDLWFPLKFPMRSTNLQGHPKPETLVPHMLGVLNQYQQALRWSGYHIAKKTSSKYCIYLFSIRYIKSLCLQTYVTWGMLRCCFFFLNNYRMGPPFELAFSCRKKVVEFYGW